MDMKVTGYGSIKSATNLRRKDGASSAGTFSELLDAAATEGPSGPTGITGTAALGNLLALQEISEEERKRERLVKKGKTMLDSLDRLRSQLLIGEIPSHMLVELAQNLSQQKEGVVDPGLLSVIEDIELRVAVELAKLEMSFAAKAEI